MSVGVIDVGSNTMRLLVAAASPRGVSTVYQRRAVLGLGADVERFGSIPAPKLARAVKLAASFAESAREREADRIEVVVTAPGRQASNADELVGYLGAATRADARVLTTEEEGHLAYLGAVAKAGRLPDPVAVCDVGGGSTELVLGTARGGPTWARSFAIGSLRLTARVLDGRDGQDVALLEAARREAARAFGHFAAPAPRAALATGGTARALRKLAGRSLGAPELEEAIRSLSEQPSPAIAKQYSIDQSRARTLLAGSLILAEVQRRLGVALQVARGGLRDGLALELLAAERAA